MEVTVSHGGVGFLFWLGCCVVRSQGLLIASLRVALTAWRVCWLLLGACDAQPRRSGRALVSRRERLRRWATSCILLLQLFYFLKHVQLTMKLLCVFRERRSPLSKIRNVDQGTDYLRSDSRLPV